MEPKDDMKQDIAAWLDQAAADLRIARLLMSAKEYHAVVSHCHQALEKGLKAIVLARTRNPVGEEMTSHSLSFLGRRVHIPADLHRILQDLSPEYTVSRYPLPGQEPPVRLYTEPKAKAALDGAEKVFIWIEKQLKR